MKRPNCVSLHTENAPLDTQEVVVSSTRTRIVLDTSVLVADPGCLYNFPGCDVVIPLTVVEELDGLKTRMDDVGRSARTALRSIEDLRRKAGGSLASPQPVHDGPEAGTLQIEVNGIQKHLLIEHGMDPEIPDNRIIGAALGQARHAATRVISNDAALRIKAAHLGLSADEHQPITHGLDSRPVGWVQIDARVDQVDALYKDSSLPMANLDGTNSLVDNNFVVLRNGSQSALARCRDGELHLLPHHSP